MTEVKVLYFDAESNRNLVERTFHGKTFSSICEIKNIAESLDLNYHGFCDVLDFFDALNDEDYPYKDWVVLVTLSHDEI